MNSKSSTLPRSNVLVLGSNSVHCLLPATLIAQADALLDRHRLEEAVDLADRHLKRLQARVAVGQEEADELRYVYQRIGFQCLTETLFDDAGKHFFAGHLDPRVLVRYYPHLCGTLLGEEETVDVFAGVQEHMPREASIDDIIRNYSPHLAPNTSTAPPTIELREILNMAAADMLKVFLRKWRAKRRDEVHDRRANEVVDTVLARLYTESGETTDLLALIGGPNDIVLHELEPVLIRSSRYDALCRLYKTRGQEAKLLDAWSKLITGEWIDLDVHDPLSSMFMFLNEKRDKALAQEWGTWLLKYDQDQAMRLLFTVGLGKRTAKGGAEESALLRRIQEADPRAAAQFLENLVLNRRSADPDLHNQLASVYVDQLLSCFADESISKLWRAKAASYTSGKVDVPFLSYFASTTPDSDSKETRLRTALFLQGSRFYDPELIRRRLEEHEQKKVLSLEVAVVLGKLGRHREALSALVLDLHDSASAEIYCTLGGAVISPKVAHLLGERFQLQRWAALITPLPMANKATPMEREKTVDEGLKKDLTKILLGVYMSGGEAMAERAAQLLSAQGMNLDGEEVLATIPSEWPLRVLSSFLARSLRRTLHARHEGQLVKAIATSENLAVAERTWLVLREEGAVIEEAMDGDGDDDGSADEKGGESGLGLSLDEKAELVRPAQGGGEAPVVDFT
ncbi:uncharacterized protein PHACADRAFT_252272 [Phanerochaete carnosa HHB-10118-sp]|uniref:Vacuolar sorting protein 39/Transforming growth factor beta receptor-associated domain-containing protein n=1 Tax=Phanerochaete carnosa (strain HHB-10118-sp) TaxID=650164 RepID=K5W2R3_PHACS|nr:uncharacterized protein PHACADRAFT_252272 [Phanerochaete carnosa HHB-10118-sp]EKM58173.1 hypothetical protein PHACADRAFT_252272 [Phanerochaete carnosa HHB-10118-sp]